MPFSIQADAVFQLETKKSFVLEMLVSSLHIILLRRRGKFFHISLLHLVCSSSYKISLKWPVPELSVWSYSINNFGFILPTLFLSCADYGKQFCFVVIVFRLRVNLTDSTSFNTSCLRLAQIALMQNCKLAKK